MLDFSNRRQLLAAGLSFAAMPLPGRGQQRADWPKAIKIVVPFAAGGLTDTMARLYADHMSRVLAVPVLVDNRPGVGGLVGVQTVAQAPADGSIWLFTTTGSLWQSRVLYRNVPFNADRDLTAVALVSAGPLVIAASETTPVNSMVEFVQWARTQKTSMGSFAAGSIIHMMGDALNRKYGLDMVLINYKGEAPMWNDLAGGQLSIAGGAVTGFTAVAGTKKIRAIATTGTRRSPRFADVPTLIEQGFVDSAFKLTGGWLALCAPVGTPGAMLDDVAQMVSQVESSARMKALQANLGVAVAPIIGRKEAMDQWKSEAPQWISVAQDLGIRLD